MVFVPIIMLRHWRAHRSQSKEGTIPPFLHRFSFLTSSDFSHIFYFHLPLNKPLGLVTLSMCPTAFFLIRHRNRGVYELKRVFKRLKLRTKCAAGRYDKY